MSHPFFDGVDWDALYYRKVRGPIIPKVEWAGDAGNFDDYPDPDPDEVMDVDPGGVEGDVSAAAAAAAAAAGGGGGGGGGGYTAELRAKYEKAFENF